MRPVDFPVGRIVAIALCSTALAAFGSVPSARAQVTITQFPVPTGGSRPYTIVAGPDGNLWFTESIGNKIGRINTLGTITEYVVPTPSSGPYGIAVGRDGNIWFTERFGDQIGRFSVLTHQFSEFPVAPFSQPWEIAPGPDGNLWFTEEDIAQIGRISPQGAVTEFFSGGCCFPTGIAPGVDGNIWYTIEIGDMIGRSDPFGNQMTFPIPSEQVLAWDITPGPDGNVWFTELAGRAIGRITPAGSVVEFPIPGSFSGIAGVTTGPEGNIWYTENDTDHVGAIDTSGNLLPTYDTPAGSRPLSITTGPDGNLWFTMADGNAIGRVNVAPPNAGFVLSMDYGYSPTRRNVQMGETVKWMFIGPGVHSVVDDSGLGLFDSGPHSIVSYYTQLFRAASTYVYKDGITAATKPGRINVPVSLPPSGTVNQPFTVTWALMTPGGGIVFDVQVETPDSPVWVPWQTSSQVAGEYIPTIAGHYHFRSRMRHTTTGATTLYSSSATITVQ